MARRLHRNRMDCLEYWGTGVDESVDGEYSEFVLWAPTYKLMNRRILRSILVRQELYRIYPSRPEPGPACSMTIIIIFVVYVYLLLGSDAVL